MIGTHAAGNSTFGIGSVAKLTDWHAESVATAEQQGHSAGRDTQGKGSGTGPCTRRRARPRWGALSRRSVR